MAGEIEFLDSEATPGDDEEFCTQPGRHRRSGISRTGRVVAGFGVAALIGGALLARVATGDGRSSAAAPSTGPSRVGTSYVATSPLTGSVAAIVLDPSTGNEALPAQKLCAQQARMLGAAALPGDLSTRPVTRPRIAGITTPTGKALVPPGDDSATCVSAAAATCSEANDGLSACTTAQGLPAAVFAAVREQFPGAHVSSAFTEIARETRLIWYRSITVTLEPGVSFDITLEQSGNDPGKTGVRNYSDLIQDARAVHVGPHLNTIVAYSGQFGPVTLRDLSMLASDDRLATVS